MNPATATPSGAALRPGTPEAAGLDAARLEAARRLLQDWVDDGSVPGAALAVARYGVVLPTQVFGVRRRQDLVVPMTTDGVFLVASVTKPLTAIALMQLVEKGRVGLTDRVAEHIPEFIGPGKSEVRVEHLLTHTSGLPDMLPQNVALRARHAPLSEFVAATCRCGLLFAPGKRVSYQSMGTLLVGEIVARVTGDPLPEVMTRTIFEPLGMGDTHLGIRPDLEARTADVVLPAEQEGTAWHWNSDYWRRLGAPWGGMFATVDDLLRLLVTCLGQGALEGARILGSATVRTMLSDRTARMPDLPTADRRRRRWGLGWQLGVWGDLCSPRSFSHSGATGTLVGADPDTGLAMAVFTTRPGAPLHRVATAVQSAVID